ncbi:hypothetical protein LXL04_027141 [Taraxacum kok-saghyz]
MPSKKWFFHTSVAMMTTDQVNALGLYPPYITPQACGQCIKNFTNSLLSNCPGDKEAVMWTANCMLRYSDQKIYGVLDNWHVAIDVSKVLVPKGKDMEKALIDLVGRLQKKATEGIKVKFAYGYLKYATGADTSCRLIKFFRVLMAANPTNQQLLAAANIASTNLNFQIPSISIKLDCTNYSLWRTTIISALECFDLDSFILNPSPPPETIPAPPADGEEQPAAVIGATIPNPDFVTWKKKDRFVLLWLKSTLTERSLASVARSTSARQASLTLDRTFQAQTRAQRMGLKNQLQTLTKGASTMIDYIDQKRQIADALAENLTPIADEVLIGYILNGLDSSCSSFASAFLMHSESTTVDDLVGLLLQEEARIDADLARQAITPIASNPPPTQSPSFPVANQVHRNYNSNRSASSGSSSTPTDRSNNTSNSYRGSDNQRRRLHCQLCNKPGHEAINCWQWANQTDYPSRRPNNRDSQRQAHLITNPSPSAMEQPWFFDSAATDHVTPDLTKLHIQEPYTGDDRLQVGNGNHLLISHFGSSSLSSLELPKVFVVPRLTKNLLSVSQLTRDNNVFMEFWPHKCDVKSFQGKPLLQGHVDRGLYCLPLSSNKASTTMALSDVRTSLTGWHNRLAHPHEAILRRLVSHFNLPVSSNNLSRVCEPCQMGKSHKLPFPSSHVLQHVINFRAMVKTQFGCDIKQFQSDWGGEYRTVSKYLHSCGINHRLSCPILRNKMVPLNGAIALLWKKDSPC